MNKDIRIRTTFPGHPKTKKLIRKLGHEGFYSLVSLWCFIAENKPDGVLKNMDVEDIAIAANWSGDAELFVDSLIRCGFLEKDDGGQLCVHDWIEHNTYAAYAPIRSQIARQNVLKRWEKKGKTNNTAKPASEANLIQSVIPLDTNGYTPSPSPIPSPYPFPIPKEVGCFQSEIETTQQDGSKKKNGNGKKQYTDEEWLLHLKSNPAYQGIDVERVKGKMEAWCQLNGKQPTRKRLLYWLNREDRPMVSSEKFLDSLNTRRIIDAKTRDF